MTQTKLEIEEWYSRTDPWEYKTNEHDIFRKRLILSILDIYGPYYSRALDIGAGEGWVTGSLPSELLFGYEFSDTAAARFPINVTRTTAPEGKYDLIITTGTLYPQYDWPSMLEIIQNHAAGIVLTCNIKEWEMFAAIAGIPGKQIFEAEFPYREYKQKLRVFRC